MRDISELVEAHPEGEEEERFRFECAGGSVTVAAAQDRLTPYGGAAAWSHYLEKLARAEPKGSGRCLLISRYGQRPRRVSGRRRGPS